MKPLPEAKRLEPPRMTGRHTVEECDSMLKQPLPPEVRDAWLDERLAAMQATCLDELYFDEEDAA